MRHPIFAVILLVWGLRTLQKVSRELQNQTKEQIANAICSFVARPPNNDNIFPLKVFVMENILFLQLQFNNDIMATVTINYDNRNVLVKSILRSAILAGATQVATKKMSPLDMALEDVRSGNVTTIFTPSYDREKRQ
jgi:hypothetical protein